MPHEETWRHIIEKSMLSYGFNNFDFWLIGCLCSSLQQVKAGGKLAYFHIYLSLSGARKTKTMVLANFGSFLSL